MIVDLLVIVFPCKDHRDWPMSSPLASTASTLFPTQSLVYGTNTLCSRADDLEQTYGFERDWLDIPDTPFRLATGICLVFADRPTCITRDGCEYPVFHRYSSDFHIQHYPFSVHRVAGGEQDPKQTTGSLRDD
jgi:hypothetical protein